MKTFFCNSCQYSGIFGHEFPTPQNLTASAEPQMGVIPPLHGPLLTILCVDVNMNEEYSTKKSAISRDEEDLPRQAENGNTFSITSSLRGGYTPRT